jgi:hypothetical protein
MTLDTRKGPRTAATGTIAIDENFGSRASSITGGELVSTGVVKQLGACRGVGPRKTLTIANLTANDENYALAA